ncbi:MAG: galactose ABC transporter substrate-binding protein [Acholeplasmatales bacterium]|jgi:methyl-galactoside transport system substrate-binding protein|nr:galactose ABC transporter substrate-binding protein [Acholeplasmatales bacterium]
MKKVFLISLFLLNIFSFFSCVTKSIQIGILIYYEEDTYMKEYANNIIKNLPSGVNYTIDYASNSQTVQNKQVIKLLDSKIDLLIVNPVDRLSCKTITELSESKNVPIIFINREPILSDISFYKNVYYVGSNPSSQGKLQAKMIKEVAGNPKSLNPTFDRNSDSKIQAIVLKGEQGHQDAENRTSYLISELYGYGYDLEILDVVVCDWKRDVAFKVMSELFNKFENIEYVFSNNDDMALGAIDFFKEIKLFNESETFNQPICVVGVDGTIVGIDSIKKGLMYGTILNDSLSQSLAVISILEYFLGFTSRISEDYTIINDKFVFIDGIIITKTNSLLNITS